MMMSPDTEQLVRILRDTVAALVCRDSPDLTLRQLTVFLTCYLQDHDHTVRGLAAGLKVPKSSISRALDRLGEFDLARRAPVLSDRRSVLVQRTATGHAFLLDLQKTIGEAAASGLVQRTPGQSPRTPAEV